MVLAGVSSCINFTFFSCEMPIILMSYYSLSKTSTIDSLNFQYLEMLFVFLRPAFRCLENKICAVFPETDFIFRIVIKFS